MIMYPAEYNVVYVDRRARQDRVQHREDFLPSPISSGPESYDGNDGVQDEHEEVIQNLQCLLAVFSSVSICISGPSCISLLSEVDKNDPTPTLVLLDIPWEPQPGEEISGHEGRHDSGVAGGPADMLYGLPLLKFICIEVENKRMSGLVVPIVFLTNRDGSGVDELHNGPPYWNNEKEHVFEGRELECIDCGAVDVFMSPIPKDKAKALYVHCHRARRNIQKSRKVSWVGVDERVDEQKPAREASEYAYLREKMVSELMTDICKPKKTVFVHRGNQPRISSGRIEMIKQAIGSWSFSAHDFTDEELVYSALLMFQHALQMPEVAAYQLPLDRIMDFLTACRASYNPKIPYHNFRHVVDVLQAVFYFLLQLRALPPFTHDNSAAPGRPLPPKSLSSILTPLDALTLLVVAIGHDVGHPGVNNAFLVTLKAPLAQVYNDRSVLESFHCAAFSQVLRKYWPKCLDMRKAMIDMILATDMGLHFDYMGKLDKMKTMFEKDGGSDSWDDKIIAEHKTLICALLIKCADISNVARVHECSARWATILIDEFSRQASMEADLKIPTSLVVPPVTGSVLALAKSQVGFMSLFAVPLFQQLSDVLPEMKFSVDVLKENKSKWSAKIEAFTPNSEGKISGNSPSKPFLTADAKFPQVGGANRNGNTPDFDKPRNNSTTHQQSVLGPVLMESDHHVYSRVSSRVDSQKSAQQSLTAESAEQSKVKVVVTQPKQIPSATNGNALKPSGEKRPTYQHSSEHLSAQKPAESTVLDRPRSSPPDLGDSSDHSCTKGCCGATNVVVTTNTVERRPSSFFKKVKSWRSWRKDHSSDG